MHWDVPIEWSAAARKVATRLPRIGKFSGFLRAVRPELFDAAFEAELATAYKTPRGMRPLPPALLAMGTVLQADEQGGEADAVLTATMDQRGQLVLGTLGQEAAPFSPGALVAFRARLITQNLDRGLGSRTVAWARHTGKFGWQPLQAALDSWPLLGAGRGEDPWNWLGRAMHQLVVWASQGTGRAAEGIPGQARVTLLSAASWKTALACDWDDLHERPAALQRLVGEAEALGAWGQKLSGAAAKKPPLRNAWEALSQLMRQDLEPDPAGGGSQLRRGTARARVPSLGERERRHGRKSKAQPCTGDKRHVLRLRGSNLVVDALALPANQPEHAALEQLWPALAPHGTPASLFLDRAYLSRPLIGSLTAAGVRIVARPWPLRHGERFTQEQCQIKLDTREVPCPAGVTVPLAEAAHRVHFPAATCRQGTVQRGCTTSRRGRTLSIHPQEALWLGLRAARRPADGRQARRQRTAVEHTFARFDQIPGKRARYKGTRKNTLDLRRTAAVHNLQHIARGQTLERAA